MTDIMTLEDAIEIAERDEDDAWLLVIEAGTLLVDEIRKRRRFGHCFPASVVRLVDHFDKVFKAAEDETRKKQQTIREAYEL